MSICDVSRRTFLRGATAAALAPAVGCRTFGVGAAGATPNYWCTWATQANTIRRMKAAGQSLFPGDQGLPGCRDNLDEKTLFGPQGWARTLYPESRAGLNLLLDDGWDVGYGYNPYQNTDKFGSLILDGRRFPSIAGTPAQKLKELTKRAKDLGWAGCGLWVACQCPGEGWCHHEPAAKREEDLRRKLGWCGEAGIAYLKVDWGAHDGDVAYRRMMSEFKRQYCPDTLIEHALTWGVPLNGCSADGGRFAVGTGRCLGDAGFAKRIGGRAPEILSFADVFRIYDLTSPLFYPMALERAFVLLEMAERTGVSPMINVEDIVYLGAALGCPAGVMRANVWEEGGKSVMPRSRMTGEATRFVAWQRHAPAFGARRDLPTRHSEKTLTDTWTFREGDTWFGPVLGHTVPQTAPAVVARGLGLPVVTDCGAGVPYVVASRHPDGAVAVAALPRLEDGKGFRSPEADVYVPADARGVPVGVFGKFGTLTFDCPDRRVSVHACDLAGDVEHDITSSCRFEGGRVSLPGDLLAKIGTEAIHDRSLPGARVGFHVP